MQVATWNVNGIRAREAEFLEWATRARPDVICLQETKATREQLPEAVAALPEYWSYWHGVAKGYSGVSLLLRKSHFPDEPLFGHPAFDHEGRIVQATTQTSGHAELVVASVYVPNGGKDFAAKMVFLAAMEAYVASVHASGARLVLCGDLNVARTEVDVHPSQRRPNLIGQLPEERAMIERILARGLVDVGRALEPENERLFTWWPYWREARKRNLGWRLDYVLASESLDRTSCVVEKETGTSDHAPVIAGLYDGESD